MCSCQPRKKKPFIDKKAAQKFSVVHRSQQDPSYYEEGSSKYVLMPADEATAAAVAEANADREGGADAGAAARVPQLVRGPGGIAELREVDEEGNALDGYDYGQHYRPIGGGTFITADGTKIDTSNAGFDRDESGAAGGAGAASGGDTEAPVVMPADVMPGEEVERMLSAITSNLDSMPEDVRAALEAEDEGADVEELEDDFVVEAMQRGDETADFDFDAHIAALIAKAEASERRAPAKKEEHKVHFIGADGEELSDHPSDDEEFPTDDEDDEYWNPTGGADESKGAEDGSEGEEADGAVAPAPSKAYLNTGRMIDEELEVVLTQYTDDQIGELDEEDPSVVGRGVAPDLLERMIDKYHDDLKHIPVDEVFTKPTEEEKEAEAAKVAAAIASGEDKAAARREAERAERERLAVIEDGPQVGARRGGFDAETIVSTFTNTENHPKVLDDDQAPVIRLSRKTGIPIVRRQRKRRDGAGGDIDTVDESEEGAGGAGAGSDEEDYEDDDGRGSHASGVRHSPIALPGEARNKKETAEEKRARKAAVKAARREARAAKKSLKSAFKEEERRQRKVKGPSRVGASVFTLA